MNQAVVVARDNPHDRVSDFTCQDCGQLFRSAADYSNHFKRAPGALRITGCMGPHQQATAGMVEQVEQA